MARSQGRKRKIQWLMATEGLSYSDAVREYNRRASSNSKRANSPAPAGERWARLAVSPAMRKFAEDSERRRKEIVGLTAMPAMFRLA
ncbi:hypothetical protein J4573_41660, partial [Actinomadura barringtoniae]